MTNAKFSTFPTELRASFGVLRATWRTCAKIIFLPLIPLAFTFPYLIILYSSLQTNEFPALNAASVVVGAIALIALIAFLILQEIIRAALFAVFSLGQNIGARKALQIGTRRFPTFLYTDILVFVYLAVAIVPLVVLIFWTNNGGEELLLSIFNPIIANIVLFIGFIIFIVPIVVTATWLSFAQIIVATGKNTGFHALTYSTTLVRPVMFKILLKIVTWIIFAGVISYAVSPLPIFYWLIPLIINLWGVSFLITLYKETRGEAITSPVRQTRRTPRKKAA